MTALQEALGDLGYLAGPNSGIYDDETEEAVRLFQRDYRLRWTARPGRRRRTSSKTWPRAPRTS